LTPVATALFANSSRLEGAESGWRSFRQAIWRETDPDRCGIPSIAFEPDFDMARWLDWVLSVPTIFRHRARGLVPTGGVPFRDLMGLSGCQALKIDDWETHASTIFTDVRSYTYIEIRCADLLPDGWAFGVPAFWAGLLYHEDALDGALALGQPCDDAARWSEAMFSAGRLGLDGMASGRNLRELAAEAVRLALHGLEHGAACVVDPAHSVTPLRALAERVGIPVGT
jgi:glutamate--cysteine ligase